MACCGIQSNSQLRAVSKTNDWRWVQSEEGNNGDCLTEDITLTRPATELMCAALEVTRVLIFNTQMLSCWKCKSSAVPTNGTLIETNDFQKKVAINPLYRSFYISCDKRYFNCEQFWRQVSIADVLLSVSTPWKVKCIIQNMLWSNKNEK